MVKEKLNLTLDAKVIEALKVQAVMEKRSVSEMIEELAGIYLKRFENFHKLVKKQQK